MALRKFFARLTEGKSLPEFDWNAGIRVLATFCRDGWQQKNVCMGMFAGRAESKLRLAEVEAYLKPS